MFKIRKKLQLNNNNKGTKTFYDSYNNEFLVYCKARNLRPATIKHYNGIINYSFKNFLSYQYNSEDVVLNTITQDLLDNYIAYLKDVQEVKDVTVNTNIRGLRAILYYFMKLGYIKEFKVAEFKFDKEPIETYTDTELKILLKKPNIKDCSFLEFRNYCIINFLLGTGCRVSTLINIKIKDLDMQNELIIYRHNKNRRGQVVPISHKLKLVLTEYLQYRQAETEEDYLFPNAYGKQLQAHILHQNLAKYHKERGITKTGIHRFRHTFAKLWILNKGDIFKLQKILNHSSMEMVKNYVNMFTEDLKQNFNECNPLESLNNNSKFIKIKR